MDKAQYDTLLLQRRENAQKALTTPSQVDNKVNIQSSPPMKSNLRTPSIISDTANALFKIPVFLSYATPYNALQMEFLSRVIEQIQLNLLFPRTLGRSDQNTETPLAAIRRMVISSYGLIAIAFRRAFVEKAISRPGTPAEQTFEDFWLSSPYLQIEPSMAFQQGLPVTLFVENGVSMNGVFGGVLQLGATPLNVVTFNLGNQVDINNFFDSVFWRETFLDWTGQVRECYDQRTQPEFKCSCSC